MPMYKVCPESIFLLAGKTKKNEYKKIQFIV